ncbi:MAG: hypothetical protein EHM42_07040 [Planctomycetaceae bacterium]|nr:MAG: hypothetical protein EHM42_07040 [Planctomycetaceae bacterium]
MRDHDAAMLVYVQLAELSQSRGQLLPRDRFLLIAGAAALNAGYPAVAQRCRELILAHNPAHLAGRFATLAEAIRDDDFQKLLERTERNCPFEKAEHLLAGLEICTPPQSLPPGQSLGEFALERLGRSESARKPLH